jgi:hypothetical protein
MMKNEKNQTFVGLYQKYSHYNKFESQFTIIALMIALKV